MAPKFKEIPELAKQTKFIQIRVKSIFFFGQSATAIYFYDMTHHMESLKLD